MLSSFLVFFAGCVRVIVECGSNETLNQCAPCPPEDTCYATEEYVCLRSYFFCSAACLCKEGFIRKTAGEECIPDKECERSCGKNEEYTECKQTSSNETCASIGSPLTFTKAEPCKPGCSCKFGYFREEVEDLADTGCIIPRCLCPQMKGEPGCGPTIG